MWFSRSTDATSSCHPADSVGGSAVDERLRFASAEPPTGHTSEPGRTGYGLSAAWNKRMARARKSPETLAVTGRTWVWAGDARAGLRPSMVELGVVPAPRSRRPVRLLGVVRL
jgi:hypothetical protein